MNEQPRFVPVDYDPFLRKAEIKTAPTTEPQKEIFTNIKIGGDAANLAYNESVSLRCAGEFDDASFDKAASALVERHEALRSAFSPDGEQIIIHAQGGITISRHDFSSLSAKEKEARLSNLLIDETNIPFDLSTGPLLRIAVVKLESKLHQIIFTIHHIIGDGWSLGICLIDLSKFYSSIKKNKPADLHPAEGWIEFALNEAEYQKSAEHQSVENYWIGKFSGELPQIELPVNKARPPLRTFAASRLDFPVDTQLTDQLKALGAKCGCSLVNTMIAAFEIFLYRITQKTDVVTGLPAAGQSVLGKQNLVGHCVNLLPLRTEINPDENFIEYLKRRKSGLMDDFEHQRFTLGNLIRKLHISRDASRIPLVPAAFNIDMGLTNGVEFDGLTFEFSTNPRYFENFEWFINCAGTGNKLIIECTYNSDLFEKSMMELRMAEFIELMRSITRHPSGQVKYLNLLPQDELQKIIIEWNNNFIGYDADGCMHAEFEMQVQRNEDAIAIWYRRNTITYRELNARANRLAHKLRKSNMGPGKLIAVCMERTPDLIISMMAVLKSGGAYVPVDPSYPADRIAFILNDSNAPVLICSSQTKNNLPDTEAEIIIADKFFESDASFPVTNPERINKSSDLAYIIYTSGSTGTPKGVAICHRSDLALFAWAKGVYSDKELDGVLASTSVCFDLSVYEIFFTLAAGGRIVLVNNALDLPELSADAKVRLINTVPSAMAELLKMKNGIPLSVLTINLAGEPLPSDLVDKIYERTSATRVFDLYGPSEDTTYSTCALRKKGEPATIGKIINNSQLYLLDKNMQPVPVGIPGEIYIGGDGLAQGYLNRPELTAEKFVANPFSIEPESRLYKTGDLARFCLDGNIEFLGRIDNQIKLRGFRIEIGEIENVLRKHENVFETIIVLRVFPDGDKKLVAYIVLKDKKDDAASLLRDYLRLHLPEFMIPSMFIILDNMPMTHNGKIDRKALPAPEAEHIAVADEKELLLQLSSTEEKLADIWKEILGIKKLKVSDNFFELGGHSLIGVRLMIEIEKWLGVKLSLQALFKAPTIEGLARIIDSEESTLEWKPVIALQPEGSRTPLFCIHMHNGNIYRWNVLKKYLPPDQPLYTIQPIGLDKIENAHRNIPEMAQHYISLMRGIQPKGPYNLAGLCFGGMVVFEMALQLEQAGEKAVLAIMVNNYAPLENQKYYRMRKEFEGFLKLGITEKLKYAVKKNIGLGRKIKNKALSVFARASGEELPPPDPIHNDIRFIHGTALLNYNPTTPLNGDVFIIRTGGPVDDPEFYDESLGWKRLVKGKIEIVQVENSDNDSIIEDELYSAQLASLIRNKLDEVWNYKEQVAL